MELPLSLHLTSPCCPINGLASPFVLLTCTLFLPGPEFVNFAWFDAIEIHMYLITQYDSFRPNLRTTLIFQMPHIVLS